MVLKRVRYKGRYPEVEVQDAADQWVTVKKGGHIDVPTRMANAMAAQEENWEIVDPPAPKKDEKPADTPASKRGKAAENVGQPETPPAPAPPA